MKKLIYSCIFFFTALLSATTTWGAAPEALAVASSTGSSYAGQWTFLAAEFRDDDGHGDLAIAFVKVNEELPGTSACYVRYSPQSGLMHLRDDDNEVWLGDGLAPGSPGAILSNSQCTIDVEQSWAETFGTDGLRLGLSIRYSEDFIDTQVTKNVYLLATDQAGEISPWETVGSWTIYPPNPSTRPATVALEPQLPTTSFIGQETYFIAEFSDANGWQDLVFMNMLIDEDTTGITSCGVQYRGDLDQFNLRNDDSTGWLLGGTPGTPGASVDNGQCILNVEKSSVEVVDLETLRIRAYLTFKAEFIADGAPNDKTLSFWTADSANLNAGGWRRQGTWTIVEPPPPAAPSAAVIEPSLPTTSYVDQSTDLTVEFSDANGWNELMFMNMQINDDGTAGHTSCAVRYFALTGQLYLRNDESTAWLPAGEPGSPNASIDNSQCILNVEKSSVEPVGLETLRVRVHLTFKLGFLADGAPNDKDVDLWVGDSTGLNANGWLHQGVWTILEPAPPMPPIPGNISPEPPMTLYTDNAAEIQVDFHDINGAANIDSAFVLINEDTSENTAAMIWYEQNQNLLFLRDDEGENWLEGYAAPEPLGPRSATPRSTWIFLAARSNR